MSSNYFVIDGLEELISSSVNLPKSVVLFLLFEEAHSQRIFNGKMDIFGDIQMSLEYSSTPTLLHISLIKDWNKKISKPFILLIPNIREHKLTNTKKNVV